MDFFRSYFQLSVQFFVGAIERMSGSSKVGGITLFSPSVMKRIESEVSKETPEKKSKKSKKQKTEAQISAVDMDSHLKELGLIQTK